MLSPGMISMFAAMAIAAYCFIADCPTEKVEEAPPGTIL